jgi:mannose/fructose-specific phosphotransferase system component IIA
MFVSDTTLARAVTFPAGQGSEDLEVAVRRAVADMGLNDGILALVDLPGGTPAKAVASLLPENDRLEVVTGVNVPMLAEALMYRNSMSLSALVEQAVLSGTEGILDVKKMLQLHNKEV